MAKLGKSAEKTRKRIHQLRVGLRNLGAFERELAPDFEKGVLLEIKAGIGRQRASAEAELASETEALWRAVHKYRRRDETEAS